MAAYVYVLLSRSRPKRTYVGWTLDLERRLAQHNGGSGAKFTRGGAWQLVYAERHRTRNGAMRREVLLKRNRKFRAILREQ
jgi:putative endonuclease